MKARVSTVLICLSMFFAVPALAGEDDSQAAVGPKTELSNAAKASLSHALQFGLRAALVGGYNMIFRYDQSPLCAAYQSDKQAKDQQKFCGHAAPLALDLAISFALRDVVEPFVFLRLGLAHEGQTDTQPLRVVGAGVRIYTMSDSAFKVFIEPALGYEFEHGGTSQAFQRNRAEYKSDLSIHLAAGPQLDLAKWLGVFVHAGLTTGILRSLHSELELSGGVQARLP